MSAPSATPAYHDPAMRRRPSFAPELAWSSRSRSIDSSVFAAGPPKVSSRPQLVGENAGKQMGTYLQYPGQTHWTRVCFGRTSPSPAYERGRSGENMGDRQSKDAGQRKP